MKRIVTGFLVAFFAFAVQVHAQMQISRSVQQALPQTAISIAKSQTAGSSVKLPSPLPGNNDQPLAIYKTEGINYYTDTTGGNWWVFTPVLNQSTGDSVGQLVFNSTFYDEADDTIGPIEIGYQKTQGGPVLDTTAFDTMYNRVMGLRVSPPTDLGTTLKLDSASITFFPESVNTADHLEVWVVPINDEPFENDDIFPIPDINVTTPVASASIPASAMTLGQLNTLTVSFESRTLSSPSEKNQLGLCMFIDGPDFPGDTLGYMLEADVQTQLGTSLVIDTDGSSGQITNTNNDSDIAMRTYKLDLDAGNLIINGNPPGYVGGGGGFFVDFSQFDPTDGMPTGNAFEGNLIATTYFHGTAIAGVNESSLSGYGLGEMYPDPVSTTANINYNIGISGPVSLTVYNTLGQKVAELVNSVQGVGVHSATFNAGTLPDGIYYYTIQSGEFTSTNSMVIAR
jgi:hypothetical protein